MRKLTVDDILDVRAYERERDELRRRVIDLKRVRRIGLGAVMTIVFENTLTMRWQVQEMARVERMSSDAQIAHEVDTYNQLIPDAGELSATLMIELTSEPALREWLPRLVGIERHIVFLLPGGIRVVGAISDEDEVRLSRDDITAAVHFLKFRFTPEQVTAFSGGAVHLVVDHPEYAHDVLLSPEQHAELLADLRDCS
jgi:Protein of unknown function (DUF3501)